jgi:cardiolipin synthase A/B
MLAAIGAAQKSVGLQSYIFRADKAGEAFHQALIQAQRRGVEVRVLIDGVGGGYFWSGTYNHLRRAGVPVARFLHSYFPWRMPFVNLRNHRKVLVIDGRLAFTGGINIGAENLCADDPPHLVLDTHFQVEGPIVDQLTDAFADDWLFATGEKLLTENWFPPLDKAGQVTARVVTSGPDEDMERVEFVALHAISCAHKSIRVVTPYFLPPDPLTMSLGLAALRGVTVDIILPEHSNHPVLDWARRVPLRPLIEAGCRVSLTTGPFDHSKLMVIDDAWALIGSANWDTRSFRLNFELNVELHDPAFAGRLAAVAPPTRRLTLAELDRDSLPVRLRNSAARLLQPYL